MKVDKTLKVESIRSNTAYPAYRKIVGTVHTVFNVFAGLQVIGGVFGALAIVQTQGAGLAFVLFISSLVVALLIILLSKAWY